MRHTRTKKTIAVSFIPLILVSSLFGIYLAITPISSSNFVTNWLTGVPSGTDNCPSNVPQFYFDHGLPFNLAVVHAKTLQAEDQSMSGSGQINWCIYNSSGQFEWNYATNRMLVQPSVSADGSYVLATGFQTSPGPAAEFVNEAIYLFNKEGRMLWNIPAPVLSSSINSNGSVIVANDPYLYYINNQGRILWTYAHYGYESTAVVLVNDGSQVLDGISNVPFPNDTNFGSELVMFDSSGRTIWNITLPNVLFDSTASVAVSGSHIAAGLSYTGVNGALAYYGINGKLIWSKAVSSSIQQVSFQNNGTNIFIQTNYGNTTFDLSGKMIHNQTYG